MNVCVTVSIVSCVSFFRFHSLLGSMMLTFDPIFKHQSSDLTAFFVCMMPYSIYATNSQLNF